MKASMSVAIEILKYANIAVFGALTFACLRQWRGRGDTGIRWATAAFGSLFAISLISLALQQAVATGAVMWFIKALLVVLLLFPYFLYRFAIAFDRPSWRVSLAAHVSTGTVVAWSVAVPYFPFPDAPQPLWWTLYRFAILGQWTILFAIVAGRLWGAGRHEVGIARRRMRTLAFAATGMNAAILLDGVANVPHSDTLVLTTQSLFVWSSVLFFVGLAPPGWLLRLWRRPEESAMQAAMTALFQAETQRELAAVLLPRAIGMVGARGAALVMRSGELLGRHGSTDTEHTIVQLAMTPTGTALPGVRRVEMRTGTLLIWTSRYAPFFGRDEFAMTESLGVFADIVMERCALADQRVHAEQALVYQALHDALTGLPNRILFMDRLTQAQTSLERHGGALSVLFLDLDRFKLVNDTIDHLAGDDLLQAVAQRLADTIRAGDTVARFGGDEFVILAEVSGEHDALDLGRRLIDALATPFSVAGRELSVTASIGVVVSRDLQDPVLLVRDADVAMYRAKEAGRARVELFDERARLATVNRLALERDLSGAIADRSLALHYQPIVTLTDGLVRGVEALLRWHHPRLGLTLPGEFIALAEESDLIVDLGAFALDEACRQARTWRETIPGLDDLVVWVNVSGAQFNRTDVAGVVARALDANGLPPSALGLEITESAFVAEADGLRGALLALRDLGVGIAIDDFGTGFSSLGRLKDLPADVIKIDGCFVSGLGEAAQDAAIVAACVALADALDLTVVAECIETNEQLGALVAERCLLGQGYYFSAALPADEATQYLRRNRSALAAAAPCARRRSPLALVCDDEASARFLYRSALESAGADVEAVADAAACIEWAIENRPDLALVDLCMPGHDGIWTITELRRRCPETRVVLMSSDRDFERFRQGLELGADACLVKDDVLTRLDALLLPAAS
jgi:diguanylate cyclase (GGDEF)-like protein